MDDFTMQGIEGREIMVRHKDGHVYRFEAGQDGAWEPLKLVTTLPASGADSDADSFHTDALNFIGRYVRENHPDKPNP